MATDLEDSLKVQRKALMDRQTRKKRLLQFAGDKTGLPITDVKQVQNGAVFCLILSGLCSPAELDVSNVNYLAVEPAEVLDNYQLLQAAAGSGNIEGLNNDAKLRHWARLAESESDAWKFLALLRNCYSKAGRTRYRIDIEPDATPPPPPARGRGRKRQASPNSDTMMGSSLAQIQAHHPRGVSLLDTTYGGGMPTIHPLQRTRDRDDLNTANLYSVEHDAPEEDHGTTPAVVVPPVSPVSTMRAYQCLREMLDLPGPPAEEDPTLDSGILEDWMLESAEGPRGCGLESEDEAGTVNYESCDEAGPRLCQAGRSFSDDSSFDLGGRRYGLKALDTDFETCAGCCIKNGKVYMDPLDFVYG